MRIFGRQTRLRKGLTVDGDNRFEMRSTGNFGNHTAEFTVDRLRQNYVGQYLPAIAHDGYGGFVTGGFNT